MTSPTEIPNAAIGNPVVAIGFSDAATGFLPSPPTPHGVLPLCPNPPTVLFCPDTVLNNPKTESFMIQLTQKSTIFAPSTKTTTIGHAPRGKKP